MATNQWFVRGGGKVYGPLDSARLKQLVVDGKIDQRTEVAQTDAGPWHPAGSVKGLFAQPRATNTEAAAAEPVSRAAATPSNSPPGKWHQSRVMRAIAYSTAAIFACGLGVLIWAIRTSSTNTAVGEATQSNTRLATAHPERFARGLEAGKLAAQSWIKEMPGRDDLAAMAGASAEKAIPKNTALIDSGSDEERESYAQAFIAQFTDTYKAKPKIARSRGEEEGHQAGFIWAQVGKRMPDNEMLTELAAKTAGSVSDQERKQYVAGFVSQFPVGYRKSSK